YQREIRIHCEKAGSKHTKLNTHAELGRDLRWGRQGRPQVEKLDTHSEWFLWIRGFRRRRALVPLEIIDRTRRVAYNAGSMIPDVPTRRWLAVALVLLLAGCGVEDISAE